ncbi:MAG TPA: LLM class F420-dependent oxidoreductase [Acidimicrobiia bacterium]
MRLRIFTEPQQGAHYSDISALARLAEELGFDAFFRSDHYMAFDGDGLPGPTDAWLTLAALARDTTTIRLGTLVSPVTFRYPGPLAISVAQVDQMSGGRVELGLGTGWHDGEHAAYAIPFPPIGTRFAQLEEQLEIVTGLWATPVGERFSFSGSHYSVTDSPGLPKPVQTPVPVIVGGYGAKRTPRLAATYAAEFNLPFASVELFAAAVTRVRSACEAIGRDPATLTTTVAQTVCCGANEAEVERRAAAIGQTSANLRANSLGGLPGEIVDRIGEYAAVGADAIYLQVLDLADHDHVRLVASEVAPHL